jgi:hypothetical protein
VKLDKKEALKIYESGQDVVIKTLYDMDAEIKPLKKIIESKQITLAKLSKNSSNSSKRPAPDDITKPKRKKRRTRK